MIFPLLLLNYFCNISLTLYFIYLNKQWFGNFQRTNKPKEALTCLDATPKQKMLPVRVIL